MDISVSQLNGRLATKLPPELPLGLVFVVGKVSQVNARYFVLTDDRYALNCRTTVEEASLKNGDEVRASGHLMFDNERLQYYLLARDVEVVASDPLAVLPTDSRELLAENEGLLSALAAVKARAAMAPPKKQAEMPSWVQKLAPPEVQIAGQGEDLQGTALPTVAGREVALDKGLVSMLSAAMDSDDELELTPELLAPYQVDVPVPAVEATGSAQADYLMDTAVPTTPTSYRPANREDTDWLVILLIISFLVFTIAVFVTIVLLILQ